MSGLTVMVGPETLRELGMTPKDCYWMLFTLQRSRRVYVPQGVMNDLFKGNWSHGRWFVARADVEDYMVERVLQRVGG